MRSLSGSLRTSRTAYGDAHFFLLSASTRSHRLNPLMDFLEGPELVITAVPGDAAHLLHHRRH